jgi:hypothetical protein
MQSEAQSPGLVQLNRLLEELLVALDLPAPAVHPPVRWVSSECCGLFFLTSTLERLGWVEAWSQLTDFRRGISCLLAGLALAIVGKFETAPRPLDAGLALFAGYFDEPDLAHLRQVFQEPAPELRREVLRSALPSAQVDDAAGNWSATFERLAETLLRSFASYVRGFLQATPQSVVSSFVLRPGRIRIEREAVVVAPDPNPFHVALHLSGMDAPVESVSSLGGRSLQFEMRDL